MGTMKARTGRGLNVIVRLLLKQPDRRERKGMARAVADPCRQRLPFLGIFSGDDGHGSCMSWNHASERA